MKGTRICKICGKEYEYCTTMTLQNGNRWQDVACCPEHAMEYFRNVAIARGEIKIEETKAEAQKKEVKKEVKKTSKKSSAKEVKDKIEQEIEIEDDAAI